jgi:hypothetical protein
MDWIGNVLMPMLSTAVGAVITYQAVKWNVHAETEREKQNQAALKRSLVLGIGAELEQIYGFVSHLTSLNFGMNYTLENRITEDTVSHQLELFNDPKLVERLSHLRLSLKKISQGFDVLRNPFINSAGVSPHILSHWGSYRSDCLNTIKEIIDLLDKEAPGVLGIEMDTIRKSQQF